MPSPLPLRHFLLALAVVAVWGINFVVIKFALGQLPPLLMAALRFGLVLIPGLFFVPRPAVGLGNLALYGFLIGGCQFGLLYVAMDGHISPGLASLVIQVQVFFTIGLSMRISGERVRGFQWLALLLAAGGIADGRGLAAALTLGADGALLGTRLWATQESLAPLGAKQAALAAGGDGTARSAVFDILRRKHWPAPYDFRALRNDLHRSWEGRVDALRAAPEAAQASYDAGVQAGDYSRAHATVGEAIGLVHDLPEAGVLVKRLHAQAQAVLCS